MTEQVPSGDSPNLADWFVLGLVALAPAIFAIATWNADGQMYASQVFVRRYSIPIMAIELATVMFAIFVNAGPRHGIMRTPVWTRTLLVILIAIALATTAFVSPFKAHGILRTSAWLVHLLFGFSLWRLLGSRWSRLRSFVWPLCVVGILLYVLVLTAFVLSIPRGQPFDWERFSLAVTNVRQTGFYSAVGATGAIGMAAIAKTARGYWSAVGAASLCLALSYWTGTRGSIIAVPGAFAAGALFLPGMRKARAVAALIIANVAGVLMSLVYSPPVPLFGISRVSGSIVSTATTDEMASSRLTQWWLSARAIMERPLFGIGESQYAVVVPEFSKFNHPHNVFLQVAISWGLTGLACFLALVAILAWHFLAIVRRNEELAPPFLVAAGLATMSMYEGSLYHPYPIMVMALAIAFVLSADRQSAAPEPTTRQA